MEESLLKWATPIDHDVRATGETKSGDTKLKGMTVQWSFQTLESVDVIHLYEFTHVTNTRTLEPWLTALEKVAINLKRYVSVMVTLADPILYRFFRARGYSSKPGEDSRLLPLFEPRRSFAGARTAVLDDGVETMRDFIHRWAKIGNQLGHGDNELIYGNLSAVGSIDVDVEIQPDAKKPVPVMAMETLEVGDGNEATFIQWLDAWEEVATKFNRLVCFYGILTYTSAYRLLRKRNYLTKEETLVELQADVFLYHPRVRTLNRTFLGESFDLYEKEPTQTIDDFLRVWLESRKRARNYNACEILAENMRMVARTCPRMYQKKNIWIIEIQIFEVETSRQGTFTRWLEAMERISQETSQYVRVDKVINPDLEAFLIKRGYVRHVENSFYEPRVRSLLDKQAPISSAGLSLKRVRSEEEEGA
jgi:hypothetical protein